MKTSLAFKFTVFPGESQDATSWWLQSLTFRKALLLPPPSNGWRHVRITSACRALTCASYRQNITGNANGKKFWEDSSQAVSPVTGRAHRMEQEWFYIAQRNSGIARDGPWEDPEFRKLCEWSCNPLQITVQGGGGVGVQWLQSRGGSWWDRSHRINVLTTILHSDHILKLSGSSEVRFLQIQILNSLQK